MYHYYCYYYHIPNYPRSITHRDLAALTVSVWIKRYRNKMKDFCVMCFSEVRKLAFSDRPAILEG